MDSDGIKAKIVPVATTIAVLSLVAAIGVWARGAPAEVPLKIEPAVAPKSLAKREAEPPAVAPRLVVHIAGEVRHPGVYRLEPDARVGDGIQAAGGVTSLAASESLNLAAHLSDGEKFVIPKRGAVAMEIRELPRVATTTRRDESPTKATASGEDLSGYTEMNPDYHPTEPRTSRSPRPYPFAIASSDSPASERSTPARSATPKPPTLRAGGISLSSATLADLDRLPGVGPSTAQKILDERHRRGGFRTIDDLLDVKGIGPVKLAKIRPYVTL